MDGIRILMMQGGIPSYFGDDHIECKLTMQMEYYDNYMTYDINCIKLLAEKSKKLYSNW